MIHHIVLFKVRMDITSLEINEFIEGLRSLRSIPGVISLSCGEAANELLYPCYKARNGEYNYCLSVVLKDKETLEFYDKNEYHNEIKHKYIFPVIDMDKANPILAIDFDSPIFSNTTSRYNLMLTLIAMGLISVVTFPLIRSRL